MKAYRIVDWEEDYEVKASGYAADSNTPVEKLRKSELDFIRWKNHGS